MTLLCCLSCKQKEEQKVIIVPPPVEQPKKGVQQMSATRQPSSVEWLGDTYDILIVRNVDKELPKVTDENGVVYYDNSISVEIKRSDGSVFFNRIFRKSDFMQYVSHTDYGRHGALLGIVFDTVKDNALTFATSIGSPDVTSDEFVPLIMTISRMGEISVTQDTRMDTGSDGNADTTGGVTGDEEA